MSIVLWGIRSAQASSSTSCILNCCRWSHTPEPGPPRINTRPRMLDRQQRFQTGKPTGIRAVHNASIYYQCYRRVITSKVKFQTTRGNSIRTSAEAPETLRDSCHYEVRNIMMDVVELDNIMMGEWAPRLSRPDQSILPRRASKNICGYTR